MIPADLHAVFAGRSKTFGRSSPSRVWIPRTIMLSGCSDSPCCGANPARVHPVKKAIAGWRVPSHSGRHAVCRKKQPSPSLLMPCAPTSGVRNPTSPGSLSPPFNPHPVIAYFLESYLCMSFFPNRCAFPANKGEISFDFLVPGFVIFPTMLYPP